MEIMELVCEFGFELPGNQREKGKPFNCNSTVQECSAGGKISFLREKNLTHWLLRIIWGVWSWSQGQLLIGPVWGQNCSSSSTEGNCQDDTASWWGKYLRYF